MERCVYCGSHTLKTETATFKNGTEHVRLSCGDCTRFLKWAPQEKEYSELKNFILPFGKYRGKTLGQVDEADFEYLEWLGANSNNKNVQKRIKEFIEEKRKHGY